MHVFEQGQKKIEMNVFIVNCYLRCTFFWNHFHNIQGEGAYVFEQFLEATLRPWMDSDNNFVDTKNCLGIYLLKITKQIFGKVNHGLAMAFGLYKLNFNWHHIYITL